MTDLALYIHIPFCVSKCIYCNFNSSVCDDYDSYIKALCCEIEQKARNFSCRGKKLLSVYFGGGTPSLLSEEQLACIFEAIKSNFVLEDTEITLEVNPSSANKTKLKRFVELGVNRFSVGLQCANDDILRLIGRPHNTCDFVNTINILHSLSVDNISCDIMLGLPNQTIKDVEDTLKLCLDLNIPHFSCYALKVERGTPIYKMKLNLPDMDTVVDMYDVCCKVLKNNNINRYEISNYAKPNYACKHNCRYWDYGDYLAVGVSASGFVGKVRYTNIANRQKYISKINSNLPVYSSKKHIKGEECYFEYTMLALRREKGLNTQDFFNEFGVDFFAYYKEKLNKLISQGLLINKDGIITATNLYILNAILVDLLF
ncbi:MAG: radical SAM family heme chaperone HemW [Clostridia bacterium]